MVGVKTRANGNKSPAKRITEATNVSLRGLMLFVFMLRIVVPYHASHLAIVHDLIVS